MVLVTNVKVVNAALSLPLASFFHFHLEPLLVHNCAL